MQGLRRRLFTRPPRQQSVKAALPLFATENKLQGFRTVGEEYRNSVLHSEANSSLHSQLLLVNVRISQEAAIRSLYSLVS